ncbi:hypothetical protein AAVH_06941 [Aphelenchoides avenae]|nr:hypothetical protein AAVH_06941 [Aphelenchus avenae]
MHKRHHEGQMRTFDPTLPVQGTQVEGLRAGDNCPFDECDEPYRDYTGWFLHCKEKHAKYIPKGGGYVPTTLKSEDRARMPMFRCTTCMASIPIGQVFRHHAQCLASLLPETVGGFMRQRAAAYSLEPGLLKLEYGVNVLEERQLMGVLQEATDSATEAQWIEHTLRKIRSDPFLHSFVERNKDAPERHALYVVAKLRNGVVPSFADWVKDLIIYVGSSTEIFRRAPDHIKNSIPKWIGMGLKLREDENLYMFRMSITLDEQTSTASFMDPDHKRLEQLIIDALGLGTLFNIERVMSTLTMLNDCTYRNHLASHFNQLALVLFESTYTKLLKSGNYLDPDERNVWQIPVVMEELSKQ